MRPAAHLAAEQRHDEVVKQEALGEARAAEVKEQDGEGQGQVLLRRAAESRSAAASAQPLSRSSAPAKAVGQRQALGAGQLGGPPWRPWPGLCWAGPGSWAS